VRILKVGVCCGGENSTKLWQVERPPVKFHHQSRGPLPDLFLSSLLRKFCLYTYPHTNCFGFSLSEKKQKQLLPLLGLSQVRGGGGWKRERFVWKRIQSRKGTWGESKALIVENCFCVTDHSSFILLVGALQGGRKQFVSFFCLVSDFYRIVF